MCYLLQTARQAFAVTVTENQHELSLSLSLALTTGSEFDYFGRQFAFCLLRGEHIRGHRGELVDEPGAGYFLAFF